jgi:hypothetical protein
MSTIDIIILIPLVPLVPLLIVWFLPWEDWLWQRLPKVGRLAAGPYLLYASFAAWHFRLHWWAVLIGLICGIALTIWSIREMRSARKKYESI